MQCGAEVEEIFVRENEHERFSHLYSLETKVSEVDARSFDSLADSTTPQGVLAILDVSMLILVVWGRSIESL